MKKPARPPKEDRRLAAILVADVVGYTDMIGQNEAATLARMRRFWKAVTGPITSTFRGNTFKNTGDGFLSEYASSVDALSAAIAMQERSHTRNQTLPEGERISIRIGLHHDDVRAQDGDLFGLGVNIASRICPLAPPDGICISQAILDTMRGRLPINVEDLGAPDLKGIRDPIKVYRVRLGFEPPAQAPDPPQFPPQDPTGPHIVERDGMLDIDNTAAPEDIAAANTPMVRQLHPAVVAKAQTFKDAAQRMDNVPGWAGLAAAARDFATAIASPTEALPQNLGTIYAAMKTLGSFLELEQRQRQPTGHDIDPMPPDIYRAFDDLIGTSAPWLRLFPSIDGLDDKTAGFLNRPQALAEGLVITESARTEGVLAPKAATEISSLLMAGQRGGGVGEKAGTRGVRGVRNLLYRSGGFAAGFLASAISSGYSNESPLIKNVSRFLAATENSITAFLSDRSADVRQAFRWIMSKNRDTELSLPPNRVQFGEPVFEPKDQLNALPSALPFSQEAAEAMILDGLQPLTKWWPFITQLGFGQYGYDEDGQLRMRVPPYGTEVVLRFLSVLPNLKRLALIGTSIDGVEPLGGLPYLEELHVDHTNIHDLNPLTKVGVFEIVSVARVGEASVGDPLRTLSFAPSLQILSLAATKVSDVTPLGKIIGLRYLNLDSTDVADLTPLATLTRLEHLSLRDTKVTSLAPIAGLPALQTLSLTGTQIAQADSSAFQDVRRRLGLSEVRVEDLPRRMPP